MVSCHFLLTFSFSFFFFTSSFECPPDKPDGLLHRTIWEDFVETVRRRAGTLKKNKTWQVIEQTICLSPSITG